MSDCDERLQKAYHDLVRFIRWYASRNQLSGHWMLSAEDLEAEMFFALVKITPVYKNKPYKEFLIIAKTCLTNAVGMLKYKILVTGRKNELHAVSFDNNDWYDEEKGSGTQSLIVNGDGSHRVRTYFSSDQHNRGLDPQYYVDHAELIRDKFDSLGEFDRQVLDALLGGNERVALHLELNRKRKAFVFDNPTIRVTPLIVSRALCVPEKQVKNSYKRIGELFKEDKN